MALSDLNSVTVIGRVTQDLGVSPGSFAYTSKGVCRASVSIAVNRRKKDGDNWVEDVSFFNVLIWGKPAESLKQYLLKGKLIAVKGYLKQDRWEKDGLKHEKIYIVAEDVQLLGGDCHKKTDDAKVTTTQPLQNQDSFFDDIPY